MPLGADAGLVGILEGRIAILGIGPVLKVVVGSRTPRIDPSFESGRGRRDPAGCSGLDQGGTPLGHLEFLIQPMADPGFVLCHQPVVHRVARNQVVPSGS